MFEILNDQRILQKEDETYFYYMRVVINIDVT